MCQVYIWVILLNSHNSPMTCMTNEKTGFERLNNLLTITQPQELGWDLNPGINPNKYVHCLSKYYPCIIHRSRIILTDCS